MLLLLPLPVAPAIELLLLLLLPAAPASATGQFLLLHLPAAPAIELLLLLLMRSKSCLQLLNRTSSSNDS